MSHKWNKMKVSELRAIAKERSLKGYSKLKKNDLVRMLFEPPLSVVAQPLLDLPVFKPPLPVVIHPLSVLDPPLLDSPVNDDSPVLLVPTAAKEPEESLGNKVRSEMNSFADWLMSYIPPPVKKVVNKKWEALKSTVLGLFTKQKKFEMRESESAFKGFVKNYTIDGWNGIDAVSFLRAVEPQVTTLLSNNRETKIIFVLTCIMEKTDIKSGEVMSAKIPLVSKATVVLASTDVAKLYEKAKDKIMESMAAFQMLGSNWKFSRVEKLDISTIAYKPLKGSSYIKLPGYLANKKAIINMKNKDNQCFKWCVTRAMNPVKKDQEQITNKLKEQSTLLNWNGIEFPVAVNESTYRRFEKNNNISVNVYGYENEEVYPLYVSKPQADTKFVDLLLISDGEKRHYCWIKNFNRLMSKRTESGHHSTHYCKRCLIGRSTEAALANHLVYCSQHNAQRVVIPKPDTKLSFKNDNRSMRVPFIVYADFESFIKPTDTCQPDPSNSYTNRIQKHTPSSFCFYVKCFDDAVYSQEPVTFSAENEDDDVAQIFFDSLEQNIKNIYQQFKFPKKMIFTKDDAKKYAVTTTCHICEKEFKGKPTDHCHVTERKKRNCIICNEDLDDGTKVRDHCHLTGKFRGAAHNGCNLNYQVPKFIPVVFHNLSGYDSHLFIKKLRSKKVSCIPKNDENYISFSADVIVDKFTDKQGKEKTVTRSLRFIDSFRFMPSSLDALVKNLSEEQCTNLSKFYHSSQFDFLRRKGVYPYDYASSVDILSETELPSKSAFYSKLNDSDISDEDYAHAKTVWEEFGCKTFRDYHDLYNKSDVLLLSDVFENFRDVCMNNYKLDPAWYYTSPGLSWDAMLKKTKVELELLSDYDQLLMFKNGIRGGVSMISKRHAKANNKYMGEAYDSSKPPSFVTYLDANNLYGWAMSKPLPTSGFKWMTEDELNNWESLTSEEGVGCVLEVNLDYPEKLHSLHNEYPLCPESVKLDGSTVAKLIPNLNDKKHYVLHYENLKQCVSLGLKITKIHRAIWFQESAWLKEYIDLNTMLRTAAKNEFQKDFFKLMNNSIFGKTMESIENHVDIRLVTERNAAIELAAKPNYDRCTIFDENLIAVHMRRTKLVYNKPIYLGMCILDLSKTLMYEFHYNYMKKKFKEVSLLMTDTDSGFYEIKTEDFYADISADVDRWFDTSELPENHLSCIRAGVNKKVLGMFKDEASGKPIEEFVGLRAKLYSYKMFQGDEHKKCKGVKKSVVKKTITHDDYIDCLFNGAKQSRRMKVIRSYKHEVYTEEVNKIALSGDDDKRVVQDDGIHTLAHGHYRLNIGKTVCP